MMNTQNQSALKSGLWVFRVGFLFTVFVCAGQAIELENDLKIRLKINGVNRILKHWSWQEWSSGTLTASVLTVKDQVQRSPSGQKESWRSLTLSQVIEEALSEISLDQRAQVDLVVIKHVAHSMDLPRAVVMKHPLWVGVKKHQKGFSCRLPPTLFEENVPIQKELLESVDEIVLTSYRDQYGRLLLKRRTDPSAMRGEKLFIQNCAMCHDLERAQVLGFRQKLAQEKDLDFQSDPHHPPFFRWNRWQWRDWRALSRYWEAFQQENKSSFPSIFVQ